LQIRPATLGDITALTDILAESFHSRDGILSWVYPILRLGIYEDLRHRLVMSSPQYLCLVAVASSVGVSSSVYRSNQEYVLGTVEMGLRSRYAWQLSLTSRYPYLSNLAVHPQYRKQGIAQQLLSSCEQTAQRWGFSNIYLHVLENNRQAKRLYYKLGYRLKEIDSGWDSVLFGQPRRLFLQKKIGNS
jgi:ribosomal protein S18 acetylase RimI-like enzyme